MAKKLRKAFRVLAKAAPHYTKSSKSQDGYEQPDVRHDPGDIVLSHQDLVTLLPNKFERVPEHDEKEPEPSEQPLMPVAGRPQPSPSLPAPTKDSGEGANANGPETQPADGNGSATSVVPEDVTHEFPKAEKAGLKVMKHPDQKLYAVLDDGDPIKDGEDLKSKSEVNRCLDAYVKA